MLEILQFIFQSFWHFIGALLLCSVTFGGLGQMFSKKYTTNTYDGATINKTN